jgi:2-Cys peroxiredoxin 5
MLADMKCEFTKAIGMELDATQLLGNVRSKRYFMLLDDGVVHHINLEPQDTGLACLLCIQTISSKLQSKHKEKQANT